MNGKCIDIGTIQAFLDGETTQDVSLRIGRHIANCDGCTRLLAAAEDENSFVFAALDREMNALVPTQRLWNRINDSIEVEKAKEPIWKQVYAFISVSLASPSLTAAAGVLVVFGIFAAMWTMRSVDKPSDEVGFVVNAGVSPTDVGVAVPSKDIEIGTPAVNPSAADSGPIKVSNLSPKKLEQIVNGTGEIRPYTADIKTPLPAERVYIQTISDLKRSVDGRKDAVFTGDSRVSFERDLAIVNDSIERMQKVVRKNPRNQAARQVLYSSYQDKIDLLNTVAQKDELLAVTR
jgi:hypothetical protein